MGLNSSVLIVILVYSLFFSLLYFASIAITRPIVTPGISEQQAIMIAKSEPNKNSWFFSTLPNTAYNVLDFNSTYYFEESDFLQNGHDLPLVFMQANGTIVDVNGEVRDTLRMCKEVPGFGWCEFISSIKSRSPTGDLAY